MVDTGELRLGNYLQQVNHKYVYIFRVEGIRGKTIQVLYNKSVSSLTSKDAEGIPVTGEILSKCGFGETGMYDNVYHMGNFRVVTGKDGCLLQMYAGDSCFGIEVKYLHRLQNLYYALTGKELEVSLPEMGETG